MGRALAFSHVHTGKRVGILLIGINVEKATLLMKELLYVLLQLR